MHSPLHCSRTVATGVGLLFLLRLAINVVSFLCPFVKAYCLAPWGIFRPNLKKYGSWAGKYEPFFTDKILLISTVVTGASEGIGKGYATQVRWYWKGSMSEPDYGNLHMYVAGQAWTERGDY